MNQDSVIEYSLCIEKLRRDDQAFALATIIKVHGSASAKVGSKAIFDRNGKNIFGWVGGGCAERFVGEQAVESIREKAGRVVLADLDDEIFGLGVACGGKMEVFIDPITPLEKVFLPSSPGLKDLAEKLAETYGIKIFWQDGGGPLQNISEFFDRLTATLAWQRGKSNLSLREVKDLPIAYGRMKASEFGLATFVGRGRIVEALEAHFNLLGWSHQSLTLDEFEKVNIRAGEIVIIASHSSRDPRSVEKALAQRASYVGMVGSRKRALEVNDHLKMGFESARLAPLYLPSGIDFDAKNPAEIALSITVEILRERRAKS